MKRYGKFAVLIGLFLGALVWLSATGMGEARTYYKTIAELKQMGQTASGKRIRVAGEVEPGSLRRSGTVTHFRLQQGGLKLPVIYSGSAPLPDTLRDGAQAIVDGKLADHGVFQASRVQAKCASKYQARLSTASSEAR